MTKPKYSPGPWIVQKLTSDHNDYKGWNTFAIRDSRNCCLAVVGHVDRLPSEDNEANAIIMSESLDMLKVLELIEIQLSFINPPDPDMQVTMLESVRKVIEKARRKHI